MAACGMVLLLLRSPRSREGDRDNNCITPPAARHVPSCCCWPLIGWPALSWLYAAAV